LGEDEVAGGGEVLVVRVSVVRGKTEVKKGGGGAYALGVVFYPHGVLDGVGIELAGDGRHDVGGGDVTEAGAEAERVFWVGRDERGVDCLAREDDRAVVCHVGRFAVWNWFGGRGEVRWLCFWVFSLNG
jgi:hypothetical protein